MVALLAFPMRLDPTGAFVTNEDGSDECYTENLAVTVATTPGERILVPSFGVDSVFEGVAKDDLAAQVAIFGPSVTIEDVDVTWINDTSADITVTYSIDADPDSTVEDLLADDPVTYSDFASTGISASDYAQTNV